MRITTLLLFILLSAQQVNAQISISWQIKLHRILRKIIGVDADIPKRVKLLNKY